MEDLLLVPISVLVYMAIDGLIAYGKFIINNNSQKRYLWKK